MLPLVQAKTVPRVYEHPPQAPASAGPSTMTVVRPKERQVCPLLRTILKRDRRSNWLTHLLFHKSKFGCCRKPRTRIQRWGFSPACTDLTYQQNDECPLILIVGRRPLVFSGSWPAWWGPSLQLLTRTYWSQGPRGCTNSIDTGPKCIVKRLVCMHVWCGCHCVDCNCKDGWCKELKVYMVATDDNIWKGLKDAESKNVQQLLRHVWRPRKLTIQMQATVHNNNSSTYIYMIRNEHNRGA